jgi:hypothetical protein
MAPQIAKLSPAGSPLDRRSKTLPSGQKFQSDEEDLPFSVELWSSDMGALEQVVAVSASPSIGYAAYYAATREYPGRVVVLRHQDRIMSRWDAKPQ